MALFPSVVAEAGPLVFLEAMASGCFPVGTYFAGMAVSITSAKCDAQLVDDILTLDDGTEVQISKCPDGHGKIKSPLCCSQDMSCTVN